MEKENEFLRETIQKKDNEIKKLTEIIELLEDKIYKLQCDVKYYKQINKNCINEFLNK